MYKISASGKLPMGKPADTLEVGAADIAVCEGRASPPALEYNGTTTKITAGAGCTGKVTVQEICPVEGYVVQGR